MKKVIIGSMIALGVLASAAPAFADTATSTVAFAGGHREPHIASTIDSISGRGSWYISNVFPDFGKLVYLDANPGESANWQTYFLAMNYK